MDDDEADIPPRRNNVRELGIFRQITAQTEREVLTEEEINRKTRSSRKSALFNKADIAYESGISTLIFTYTTNKKGKDVVDLKATGKHAMEKLASTTGQRFKDWWRCKREALPAAEDQLFPDPDGDPHQQEPPLVDQQPMPPPEPNEHHIDQEVAAESAALEPVQQEGPIIVEHHPDQLVQEPAAVEVEPPQPQASMVESFPGQEVAESTAIPPFEQEVPLDDHNLDQQVEEPAAIQPLQAPMVERQFEKVVDEPASLALSPVENREEVEPVQHEAAATSNEENPPGPPLKKGRTEVMKNFELTGPRGVTVCSFSVFSSDSDDEVCRRILTVCNKRNFPITHVRVI